jgi:hypothetical protein
MPGVNYPNDALQQAKNAIQVMKSIDPSFQVGGASLAGLEKAVNLALANQDQITTLKSQMTDLRNQNDALTADAWDLLKRLRAGVKAAYGDNSSQYEMMGGTRLSERKKAVKKTPDAGTSQQ